MSIGAGVIIAVTFQKVDGTPDAEACAECDHESLKYINSAVKKSIVFLLLQAPLQE